tara:strand:- start:3962 stop:4309 length:348 start_codon:yes stop_codon:yes gene_type:complete
MESLTVTVVYHPNCKASTDFLINVSKLTEAQIEYINIKEDKIETSINVDFVPLMIINNDPNKIFKGKSAFEKVEELLSTSKQKPEIKAKKSSNTYSKKVSFVEQDDKKDRIDLSK